MAKSPNPAVLVNQLRSLRQRLLEERADIVAAAADRDEAIEALDEGLDALAKEALSDVNLAGLIETREGGAPVFSVPSNPGASTDTRLILGFVALINREALRDALIRTKIDAPLQGRERLATAAKRKALAALDEKLTRQEVREEVSIREAEANGAEILRRADADPAIVLATDAALEAM